MSDLLHLRYAAEQRLCPKGQPWTGDDNRTDHGHTDCYIIGGLLNALEAAEAELARLEHQIQQAEEATTAAYKDAETAEARSADLQTKLDTIRTHCQTAIETGTRSDWEEGYDEACLDILDILEAQ